MSGAARFDLIVVGAGPAGSAAAVTAGRAGLSVALIDRAPFPRDKLCGGAVSGRAQQQLAQVFGRLPDDLMRWVGRANLLHQGHHVAALSFDRPFGMTMRQDFDAALHDRALQAGAVDYSGRRIARMDLENGLLCLSDGTTLGAPLIIGADGVNSVVARRLWGRAQDPSRLALALEVEVRRPCGRAAMEVDLGAANWGYGWAFPKRNGLTLGVGGLVSRNPALRAVMEDWLVRHGAAGTVRVKGHHLPFGTFPAVPGEGRVLLAGDAAGLVDPLTGEGIAWAIHSGALAAQAAIRALAQEAPGAALRHYTAALAPVHRELRRARLCRGVLYARPLRGAVARRVLAHPGVQARYVQLLEGQLDYADLEARSFLRLVRRLALPALDRWFPPR